MSPSTTSFTRNKFLLFLRKDSLFIFVYLLLRFSSLAKPNSLKRRKNLVRTKAAIVMVKITPQAFPCEACVHHCQRKCSQYWFYRHLTSRPRINHSQCRFGNHPRRHRRTWLGIQRAPKCPSSGASLKTSRSDCSLSAGRSMAHTVDSGRQEEFGSRSSR